MIRRVFVSGGTGTIGHGLVKTFHDNGYAVSFSYRNNRERADAMIAQWGVTAYHLDFLREWQPPSISTDILVNSAGVNLSGHAFEVTSPEEIRSTMEVNFIAPFRLARHFAPNMKDQGFGRIININSLWGLHAPAHRLSYAASKFALRALTSNLAAELGPYGITVNDICPGPVDSGMLRGMARLAVEAGRFATVDDYLASCCTDVPIGRLVDASDVAGVALFLAGETAVACNGQAIRVDGGMALA